MTTDSPALRRPWIVASIMASMAMVAIEATIVSTAMPQIVTELGGLSLYSWVFASFLLTQTAMTVVFGKLADLFGRKPVMLAGIAIFLIGSVLAGFATSMPMMIAFRLIQGVGAGAIQPVAMTIVGDLYPGAQRGKVQGWLASVWAISAVIGPMAGGLIIRDFSWAWIFWINVPIGLASAAGFVMFLHEGRREARPSIDLAGALLFTIAIAALMVATTDFGPGESPALVASLVCIVSLALFTWQERRAADPMVSFQLWSFRPIAAANVASLLSGMALVGLTTFLPIYVQGVLHRSPVVAGLALTTMMVGWPTGATLAARSVRRLGLKPIMSAGSVLVPLGAICFVVLSPLSSPVLAGAGSLVMGLGMGLISVSSLMLIQEVVTTAQRGSATASNLFARNLGSTLGATLLGAVLNYGLSHGGGQGSPVHVSPDDLRRLLDASAGSPAIESDVLLVLQQALHWTFCAMLVIALGVVAAAAMIPRIRLGQAMPAAPSGGGSPSVAAAGVSALSSPACASARTPAALR